MSPRRLAIVGVGYSPIGRDSGLAVSTLAALACKAALEDAGLTPRDVDGVVEYGFPFELVTSFEIADTLGIPQLRWYADLTATAPAGIGAVIEAAAAVASGSCETCLAYRSVSRRGGHSGERGRPQSFGGDMQFSAPYGNFAAPQWYALSMRRHMDVYGTREEHFGAIAVAQREFASLNPMAILRDPLSLDDYLAARFISEPLRLLDCDLPVDGAGAVIVTTAERARDLQATPVQLESWALGTGPRPDRFQWDDLTTSGSRYAAAELWSRSDFGPADVDTAQLYDGFTILTLQWLEALGFCAAGEGGPFVAEGHTRLGGRLPTNTNGGMLNLGRVHGISHVIEAVLQLRGCCGPRQTPGARVAVAANGGGPNAGCVVLSRD